MLSFFFFFSTQNNLQDGYYYSHFLDEEVEHQSLRNILKGVCVVVVELALRPKSFLIQSHWTIVEMDVSVN